MIIIASLRATDMGLLRVGGGEEIILFVGFKKMNLSWITSEERKKKIKKTQRQFQDEPTPGENDLLVLAIKF